MLKSLMDLLSKPYGKAMFNYESAPVTLLKDMHTGKAKANGESLKEGRGIGVKRGHLYGGRRYML